MSSSVAPQHAKGRLVGDLANAEAEVAGPLEVLPSVDSGVISMLWSPVAVPQKLGQGEPESFHPRPSRIVVRSPRLRSQETSQFTLSVTTLDSEPILSSVLLPDRDNT